MVLGFYCSGFFVSMVLQFLGFRFSLGFYGSFVLQPFDCSIVLGFYMVLFIYIFIFQ